jgi:hypothetical protein
VDRKRKTVGSLVRHIRTGGIGLIEAQRMFDARWLPRGRWLRVKFIRPVDNVVQGRTLNKLTSILDRADKFELIS